MKVISQKEAWDLLIQGKERVKSKFGFFVLGDAYLITEECDAYKDQIVLVEHRGNHQYNHWGYRINKPECSFPATIFSNGDDGCGGLNETSVKIRWSKS